MTPVAVTRLNARDSVFKDGFQKIETVKRSVPKDKWGDLERQGWASPRPLDLHAIE
jgi:hypothetical protein